MITNLKCCHKVLPLNEMLKTADLKEKENSVIVEIYNKNKSVIKLFLKFSYNCSVLLLVLIMNFSHCS